MLFPTKATQLPPMSWWKHILTTIGPQQWCAFATPIQRHTLVHWEETKALKTNYSLTSELYCLYLGVGNGQCTTPSVFWQLARHITLSLGSCHVHSLGRACTCLGWMVWSLSFWRRGVEAAKSDLYIWFNLFSDLKFLWSPVISWHLWRSLCGAGCDGADCDVDVSHQFPRWLSGALWGLSRSC